MFDTEFFRRVEKLKRDIVAGRMAGVPRSEIYDRLERLRARRPFVFNIETTNLCNMTCIMCPRTTEMDRKIEHMDDGLFGSLADQITHHTKEEQNMWWKYVQGELGVQWESHTEDAFIFYVCSQAVTLHGYGEPPLDPRLAKRIRMLTERGIKSYLSCNPANVNGEKARPLFDAGLGYLKFSIDSLSEEGLIQIRGKAAKLSKSMQNVMEVLKVKQEMNARTEIVMTMIQLSRSQEEECRRFLELWKGHDVYAYVKSLDNRWHVGIQDLAENRSYYEKQYCEFPFTSLTVMVDGTVVPCTQDFNCEMNLGDAKRHSLEDIWNSETYANFRRMHVTGQFPENYRCSHRCDQKLLCNYLGTPKTRVFAVAQSL